ALDIVDLDRLRPGQRHDVLPRRGAVVPGARRDLEGAVPFHLPGEDPSVGLPDRMQEHHRPRGRLAAEVDLALDRVDFLGRLLAPTARQQRQYEDGYLRHRTAHDRPHGMLTVSPPEPVTRYTSVAGEMFCPRNRTDPSANRTLAPLAWKLYTSASLLQFTT